MLRDQDSPEQQDSKGAAANEPCYWISPVRSHDKQPTEEVIRILIGQERIYAFTERNPTKKRVKPGDWICFYAARKGIVAHARVISNPEFRPNPKVPNSDDYPWVFTLGQVRLYLEDALALDISMRKKLDCFKQLDTGKMWAWFVHTIHRISQHDFETLTQRRVTG
jgi:hypothetical protein